MTSDGWMDSSDTSAALPLGLASNPVTPVDLLLRLLERWPKQACKGLSRRGELPLPVQAAMAYHPSILVRGTLAEHPQVSPEIRARLLADPDWRVRVRAFGSPGQRPLPDDVLLRLLAEIDKPPADGSFTRGELIDELFGATNCDPRLFRLAATHPEPGVRHYAANFLGWRDDPELRALLTDPVPEVRAVATQAEAERTRVMRPSDLPGRHCHGFWSVLQRPLSRALIDQVLASGDVAALYFVGPNPTTPPDAVETLLCHPAAEVRRRVATRRDLTGEQLLRLAVDPAAEVRTAVSTHPGLTEQQRAHIDIDVTTAAGNGHYGPWKGCRRAREVADEIVPEFADALWWARSVNPLLRRRAARHPELPVDLVTLLTDDADLGVRVLLAQNHPDPPPALLLRCFLEYHGCGRERLSTLPGFPLAGLARFVDHPDPVVRRLVALDPHADARVVDRLCADPDVAVRRAMAACPRLPAERIVALLDDSELATYAAANPALPIEQMWRVLARPR